MFLEIQLNCLAGSSAAQIFRKSDCQLQLVRLSADLLVLLHASSLQLARQ